MAITLPLAFQKYGNGSIAEGGEPPVFRYRMTSEDVVLRLDFKTLGDAAAFGEDFGGGVLGINLAADAA
jgi:hypothetical protein